MAKAVTAKQQPRYDAVAVRGGALAIGPQGTHAAFVDVDGAARVIHIGCVGTEPTAGMFKLRGVYLFRNRQRRIHALAVSQKYLAITTELGTPSDDHWLSVHRLSDDVLQGSTTTLTTHNVTTAFAVRVMSFLGPHLSQLTMVLNDGSVWTLMMHTTKPSPQIGHVVGVPSAIAFSPNGRYILCTYDEEHVYRAARVSSRNHQLDWRVLCDDTPNACIDDHGAIRHHCPWCRSYHSGERMCETPLGPRETETMVAVTPTCLVQRMPHSSRCEDSSILSGCHTELVRFTQLRERSAKVDLD
jgi:hypothetical protein